MDKQGTITFGEKIRTARMSLGLTMEAFAKQIGVSKGTISLWESNKNIPPKTTISLIIKLFNLNPHWFQTSEGELFLKPPVPEAISLPRIPVLGKVPAGFPEHYEEEVIEYISPPHAPSGTYGLVVKGESMTPTLRDGDYVLFIADGDYKNGDVIIVNDEWGESMVKRYRVKPDGEVWVTSDNTEFPSFKPNENWQIVGKVIDVWRRIKL